MNAVQPETFDLRGILPPLETFLEHELQPLMAAPADAAHWHVWFRCEWCPYFEHCRDAMRATDDVSRFPYLSVHAKRYLGELDPPVRTIADLEALLDDPKRLPLLDDAATLRKKPERLKAQVKALRTGTVQFHGGHSLAMPKAEHIRVVLTLQTEPVSGQVYAFGLYAQGLKDILPQTPVLSVGVARTPDPEARDQLERRFVRELHGLLAAVDAFNRIDDEWRRQKSLQVFMFDTYERAILNDLLVRRIADPEVAEEALQLFFHFQRPELVQAEVHPATEVFFPVVVIASVLRQLTALPVEVTYRFADVVRMFPERDRPFEYHESDFFGFPLSNQLRSDAIYHAWHRGRTEFLEGIERQMRQRLRATRSLIDGLRQALDAQGSLFAWPPRFFLPDAEPYRHPVLSRLAFITRYEQVLDYLALRGARMAPIEERLRNQTTIELEALGAGRFALTEGVEDLDLEVDDFPNRVLSEVAAHGERAILAYDDFRNRDKPFVHRELAVALVGVTAIETGVNGRPSVLQLALTPSQAFGTVEVGRRYRLDSRFTDFNSKHVLDELRAVDAEDQPPFVRLLDDATGFAGPLAVPAGIRERALELARAERMTASQLRAFEGMLDRRLRLVWGPPGTGKTHFLALAILCLAEAYRFEGRRLRVLVTAFTHAAIDNCLRKIAELQATRRVVRGRIPIGKIKHKTLEGMDDVEIVYDKLGRWPWDEAVGVVGGTVWGIRKAMPASVADVLVVDEGSQLTVPESAIAIRRLDPGGRLVIGGDHRQLPPIVQGAYPDPPEGEPILHRSLFEALQAQDGGGEDGFVLTLLENWRSNETLCCYPAAQIYVPEYRPATPEVAARRIALAPVGRRLLPAGSEALGITRELLETILDPEASLVVGVLDGVRATAENRVEAGLVAALALELRSRLLARDGRPYPDGHLGDRDFWADGLFIVSPHHAQIRAINRGLWAGRRWEHRPFVDTVDKMQGQECDAVIVSYGVSDVEYAMSEKEFIYSLNRLNVSITRGRAKTIVFLPRPLIEPPIHAFEDDRIAEGVAFMQGLVRFSERVGAASNHALDASVRLKLVRLP